MHVASGIDGVSDRLGRIFPSGLLAVVCIPLYSLLGPLAGSPWRLLPAAIGVATGVVLNGFAVACVTSAYGGYSSCGQQPLGRR